MHQHGLRNAPSIPRTTRRLEVLQSDPRVWSMSPSERTSLYDTWYITASESIRQTQIEDFENLRRKHAAAQKSFDEIKEQVCLLLACCVRNLANL